MTTSICGTFYRNILAILHLLHQFLVLEAFRFLVAEPALAVFLIFRIRSLEEIYLGISFESQDMGCNPVQEPPVVRDYHSTSGKVLQTSSRARMVFTSTSLVGSSRSNTLPSSLSVRARWRRFLSPPERMPQSFS